MQEASAGLGTGGWSKGKSVTFRTGQETHIRERHQETEGHCADNLGAGSDGPTWSSSELRGAAGPAA